MTDATEGNETTKAPRKATPKGHKTLGDALAAFQADLPEISLDGVNPHFKSKYATLSHITKKVLPRLAENGLAFSVGSFVQEDGLLVLDAHLIHSASGESRSAQFPITETNPQKVGSAISYYRRYALSSLTGIVADEDDDGNAASAPAPRAVQQAEKTKVTPPAAKKTGADAVRVEIKEKYLDTGKITLDELNERVAQVQQETVNHKKDERLYKDVLASLEGDDTK